MVEPSRCIPSLFARWYALAGLVLSDLMPSAMLSHLQSPSLSVTFLTHTGEEFSDAHRYCT
jgi:hypothetical protein